MERTAEHGPSTGGLPSWGEAGGSSLEEKLSELFLGGGACVGSPFSLMTTSDR